MSRSVKPLRRPPPRGSAAWVLGGQRGVALIMVLGLLSLVGSVVADFQFSSQIDLRLAFGARDELQAEYNALSALRFRALLLKQSRKIQTTVQLLMASMGGGGSAPPIGQLLEMIPVECGLMSAITKSADKKLDGKNAQEEDFFPGDCLAVSTSEHAKIAINLLRTSINHRDQQVASLLLAMLSDPRLRKHFEQDDRNGQHAETPALLVGAVTDYIDADHTEAGGLGDEDRRYAYLKDSYRAKNAPFDSVAELQLVFGIDDGLYDLMKDGVTIYNDNPAIELSTAPIDRILYWGMPAALFDNVPIDALIPVLPALEHALRLAKAIGGGFGVLNLSILTTIVHSLNLDTNLIDPRKLNLVFTDGSGTTWYTLEAEGHVGNASRRIRTVFQAAEGQFYYARVE